MVSESRGIVSRKATIEDIGLLVRLRFEYLTEDGGIISDNDREALNRQLPRYFAEHITDNTFIGILAMIDDELAGSAYLAISAQHIAVLWLCFRNEAGK